MPKKKARIGYGVKPPYVHLGEAIDIVKRVYEDAGGSVVEDQLSTIMGNTVKSSSFNLKLMALRSFGLITPEGQGKRIGLSELAKRIVAPITPEEKLQAIKEAFLRIETYRTLHELWAGKILPTDEFFLNTIRERCRIPPELTNRWKDSFMASGAVAGLFQEREDGKIQLRLEPGTIRQVLEELSMPGRGESNAPIERQPPGRSSPPSGDMDRFQVPLLEGRIGVIELPKGWTDSDVKKMIQVMRVMFLWGEGETKQ